MQNSAGGLPAHNYSILAVRHQISSYSWVYLYIQRT